MWKLAPIFLLTSSLQFHASSGMSPLYSGDPGSSSNGFACPQDQYFCPETNECRMPGDCPQNMQQQTCPFGTVYCLERRQCIDFESFTAPYNNFGGNGFGGMANQQCGFGEVYCPDSGRCVPQSGGSAGMGSSMGRGPTSCPIGSVYCPQSGQCSPDNFGNQQQPGGNPPISCPPGMVYCPDSGRCIDNENNQQRGSFQTSNLGPVTCAFGTVYCPTSGTCIDLAAMTGAQMAGFPGTEQGRRSCAPGMVYCAQTGRCKAPENSWDQQGQSRSGSTSCPIGTVYCARSGRCLQPAEFQQQQSSSGPTSCPEGTVYCPDSGRCLWDYPKGGSGRGSSQSCGFGEVYCPQTGRCIKGNSFSKGSGSAPAGPISCQFGTVYCPKSGRCVSLEDALSDNNGGGGSSCPAGTAYCLQTGQCKPPGGDSSGGGGGSGQVGGRLNSICQGLDPSSANATFSVCLKDKHCPSSGSCCPGSASGYTECLYKTGEIVARPTSADLGSNATGSVNSSGRGSQGSSASLSVCLDTSLQPTGLTCSAKSPCASPTTVCCNGKCVADPSNKNAACGKGKKFCSLTGKCVPMAENCGLLCPPGQLYCRKDNQCYSNATRCPLADISGGLYWMAPIFEANVVASVSIEYVMTRSDVYWTFYQNDNGKISNTKFTIANLPPADTFRLYYRDNDTDIAIGDTIGFQTFFEGSFMNTPGVYIVVLNETIDRVTVQRNLVFVATKDDPARVAGVNGLSFPRHSYPTYLEAVARQPAPETPAGPIASFTQIYQSVNLEEGYAVRFGVNDLGLVTASWGFGGATMEDMMTLEALVAIEDNFDQSSRDLQFVKTLLYAKVMGNNPMFGVKVSFLDKPERRADIQADLSYATLDRRGEIVNWKTLDPRADVFIPDPYQQILELSPKENIYGEITLSVAPYMTDPETGIKIYGSPSYVYFHVQDLNDSPVAKDDFDESELPSVPALGQTGDPMTVDTLARIFFADADPSDSLGLAVVAASQNPNVGFWEYRRATSGYGEWTRIDDLGFEDLALDLRVVGWDPHGKDVSYRGRLDSMVSLGLLECNKWALMYDNISVPNYGDVPTSGCSFDPRDVPARRDMKSALRKLTSSSADRLSAALTDGGQVVDPAYYDFPMYAIQPLYLDPDDSIRFFKTGFGPLTPGQQANDTKLVIMAWDRSNGQPASERKAITLPRCADMPENVDKNDTDCGPRSSLSKDMAVLFPRQVDCNGAEFVGTDPPKMDICGVCGGDGQSCVDCKGTPYGRAFRDCRICRNANETRYSSFRDCTLQCSQYLTYPLYKEMFWNSLSNASVCDWNPTWGALPYTCNPADPTSTLTSCGLCMSNASASSITKTSGQDSCGICNGKSSCAQTTKVCDLRVNNTDICGKCMSDTDPDFNRCDRIDVPSGTVVDKTLGTWELNVIIGGLVKSNYLSVALRFVADGSTTQIDLPGIRRSGNAFVASVPSSLFSSFTGTGKIRANFTYPAGGQPTTRETSSFPVVDSRSLTITWQNGTTSSDSLFADRPFTIAAQLGAALPTGVIPSCFMVENKTQNIYLLVASVSASDRKQIYCSANSPLGKHMTGTIGINLSPGSEESSRSLAKQPILIRPPANATSVTGTTPFATYVQQGGNLQAAVMEFNSNIQCSLQSSSEAYALSLAQKNVVCAGNKLKVYFTDELNNTARSEFTALPLTVSLASVNLDSTSAPGSAFIRNDSLTKFKGMPIFQTPSVVVAPNFTLLGDKYICRVGGETLAMYEIADLRGFAGGRVTIDWTATAADGSSLKFEEYNLSWKDPGGTNRSENASLIKLLDTTQVTKGKNITVKASVRNWQGQKTEKSVTTTLTDDPLSLFIRGRSAIAANEMAVYTVEFIALCTGSASDLKFLWRINGSSSASGGTGSIFKLDPATLTVGNTYGIIVTAYLAQNPSVFATAQKSIMILPKLNGTRLAPPTSNASSSWIPDMVVGSQTAFSVGRNTLYSWTDEDWTWNCTVRREGENYGCYRAGANQRFEAYMRNVSNFDSSYLLQQPSLEIEAGILPPGRYTFTAHFFNYLNPEIPAKDTKTVEIIPGRTPAVKMIDPTSNVIIVNEGESLTLRASVQSYWKNNWVIWESASPLGFATLKMPASSVTFTKNEDPSNINVQLTIPGAADAKTKEETLQGDRWYMIKLRAIDWEGFEASVTVRIYVNGGPKRGQVEIQSGFGKAYAMVTEVPIRAAYWWDDFPLTDGIGNYSVLNYAFGYKYPSDPAPTYAKFIYNGAPQIALILPASPMKERYATIYVKVCDSMGACTEQPGPQVEVEVTALSAEDLTYALTSEVLPSLMAYPTQGFQKLAGLLGAASGTTLPSETRASLTDLCQNVIKNQISSQVTSLSNLENPAVAAQFGSFLMTATSMVNGMMKMGGSSSQAETANSLSSLADMGLDRSFSVTSVDDPNNFNSFNSGMGGEVTVNSTDAASTSTARILTVTSFGRKKRQLFDDYDDSYPAPEYVVARVPYLRVKRQSASTMVSSSTSSSNSSSTVCASDDGLKSLIISSSLTPDVLNGTFAAYELGLSTNTDNVTAKTKIISRAHEVMAAVCTKQAYPGDATVVSGSAGKNFVLSIQKFPFDSQQDKTELQLIQSQTQGFYINGTSSVIMNSSFVSNFTKWACNTSTTTAGCTTACLGVATYQSDWLESTRDILGMSPVNKSLLSAVHELRLLHSDSGIFFSESAPLTPGFTLKIPIVNDTLGKGQGFQCFHWKDCQWTNETCNATAVNVTGKLTVDCTCSRSGFVAVFADTTGKPLPGNYNSSKITAGNGTGSGSGNAATTAAVTTAAPTTSAKTSVTVQVGINETYTRVLGGRTKEATQKHIQDQLNKNFANSIRDVLVFEGKKSTPAKASRRKRSVDATLAMTYPTVLQMTIDGQAQYDIIKQVVASGNFKVTDGNGTLYRIPAQTIVEVEPAPPVKDKNLPIIIASVAGAVIVALLIFVVIAILIKAKKRQKKVSPLDPRNAQNNQPPTYRSVAFEKNLEMPGGYPAGYGSLKKNQLAANPDFHTMTEEQLYVGRKVDQTLDQQLEWGSMRAGGAGGFGGNNGPMAAMEPAYVHHPVPAVPLNDPDE